MSKHFDALERLENIIDESNSKIQNFVSRLYTKNSDKSLSDKSEMESIGRAFIVGMNLLKEDERSKKINNKIPKRRFK